MRISLGGGGTDLPSYYQEHEGFLVAGAIDKYVYMLVHTVFQQRYRMKYSETEDVEDKVPVTPTGLLARDLFPDAPRHIPSLPHQRRQVDG